MQYVTKTPYIEVHGEDSIVGIETINHFKLIWDANNTIDFETYAIQKKSMDIPV